MPSDGVNKNRRRFLVAATATVGAVGAGFVAVPFIKTWKPSARARAVGAPAPPANALGDETIRVAAACSPTCRERWRCRQPAFCLEGCGNLGACWTKQWCRSADKA